MPRSWSDLFWVALALVAGVVVLFAARAAFRRPQPRSGRWLACAAGIALLLPGSCAHAPIQRHYGPTGAGWEDGAGGFVADAPRHT